MVSSSVRQGISSRSRCHDRVVPLHVGYWHDETADELTFGPLDVTVVPTP
jgi:hypothetical protein